MAGKDGVSGPLLRPSAELGLFAAVLALALWLGWRGALSAPRAAVPLWACQALLCAGAAFRWAGGGYVVAALSAFVFTATAGLVFFVAPWETLVRGLAGRATAPYPQALGPAWLAWLALSLAAALAGHLLRRARRVKNSPPFA